MRKALLVAFFLLGGLWAVWRFAFLGLPWQVILRPPPPRQQRLAELDRRASLDVREQPFDAVVKQLAEQHGLTVEIDYSVLRSVRRTGQERVSCQLTDVRLRTLLRLLALNVHRELWVGEVDGELLVSTFSEWEQRSRLSRVYRLDRPELAPLSDLAANALNGRPNGFGNRVQELPGAFVATGTSDEHRAIEGMQRALARRQELLCQGRPATDVLWIDVDEAAERELAERLDRVVEVRIENERLDEALARLGREHGFRVWFDTDARLVPAMQTPRAPRKFPPAPLRTVLCGWLWECGLEFHTVDGVVVVSRDASAYPLHNARLVRSFHSDGAYEFWECKPRESDLYREPQVNPESTTWDVMTPRERQIEERLAAPVSLRFDETPMTDVLHELQRHTGAPVFGLEPDYGDERQVTYRCDNLPLEIACREIFRRSGLVVLQEAVFDRWQRTDIFDRNLQRRWYRAEATSVAAEAIKAFESNSRIDFGRESVCVTLSRPGHRLLLQVLKALEQRSQSPESLAPIPIERPWADHDRKLRQSFVEFLDRCEREPPKVGSRPELLKWMTSQFPALASETASVAEVDLLFLEGPAFSIREELARIRKHFDVVEGLVVIDETKPARTCVLYPIRDLLPVVNKERLEHMVVGRRDAPKQFAIVDDCLLVFGTPEQHRCTEAVLAAYRQPRNGTAIASEGHLLLELPHDHAANEELRLYDLTDLFRRAADREVRAFRLPKDIAVQSTFSPLSLRRAGHPAWHLGLSSAGDWTVGPVDLLKRAIRDAGVSCYAFGAGRFDDHAFVRGEVRTQREFQEFEKLLSRFATAPPSPPFTDGMKRGTTGELRVFDLRPLLAADPEISEPLVELWLRGTPALPKWNEVRFVFLADLQPEATVLAQFRSLPGGIIGVGLAAELDVAESQLQALSRGHFPRVAELQRSPRSAAAKLLARMKRPEPLAEWKLAVMLTLWLDEPGDELASELTEQWLALHAAERLDRIRWSSLRAAILRNERRLASCLLELQRRAGEATDAAGRAGCIRALLSLGGPAKESLRVILTRGQMADFDVLTHAELLWYRRAGVSNNPRPSDSTTHELFDALQWFEAASHNHEPARSP